jgi:hypothetical protein
LIHGNTDEEFLLPMSLFFAFDVEMNSLNVFQFKAVVVVMVVKVMGELDVIWIIIYVNVFYVFFLINN